MTERMYSIAPVSRPWWLLALGPAALSLMVALLAGSISVVRLDPPQEEGLYFLIGLVGYALALACFAAGIVGVAVLIEAYRHGRVVIFHDRLTIHYPWPRGSKSYEWHEIDRVEAIDENVLVREPVCWAPLPLASIVPGADFALSFHVYQERATIIRNFRVLDEHDRLVTVIPGSPRVSAQIALWQNRKILCDFVEFMDGSIVWRQDCPQAISLRGSRISAKHWELLKAELAVISGVEEIDLSGTLLEDAALVGLAEFSSLKMVRALGSRISLRALEQLGAVLAQRDKQGKFDFLAAK